MKDRGDGTIFMTTDVVTAQGATRSAFTVSGKPVDNIATITVSVSADGRTMTQVLTGKTGQGRAFTNTLVFDKQWPPLVAPRRAVTQMATVAERARLSPRPIASQQSLVWRFYHRLTIVNRALDDSRAPTHASPR